MIAGGNDNSKSQKTTGDITDKNGDPPGIRTLKGRRKRTKRTLHTGEKNPDGKDIISEPDGKKINCNKTRVIKIGAKNYLLILEIPQNISGGKVKIFAVGEDNSREKLSVMAADSVDTNSQIQVVNDEIVFRNMQTNSNIKINFKIADDKNYAMGVAVYED